MKFLSRARPTVPRIAAMVAVIVLSGHQTLSAGENLIPKRGTKWAVLIGVDQYQHPPFKNLSCCGADVVALRDVLVRWAGFPKEQVVVLHDQSELKPTLNVVRGTLKRILAQADPDDLVLVAFSGHGTHIAPTSYLCPADAETNRPGETMLAVTELYAMLAAPKCQAADKVVLIDACRSNLAEGRGVAIVGMQDRFAQSVAAAPPGLWVVSSCAAGQVSYEDDKKLHHGVFMHHVFEGLSGAADQRRLNPKANRDGKIDGDEVFAFASAKTNEFVLRQWKNRQTPELYCRTTRVPVLVELPPPPKTLVNKIGMQFVLIRRGNFMMGSPESEGYQNERPQHEVWITEDIYLGETEVTQEQYEKVTGMNPSYFSANGNGAARVRGRETSRLPAERVSCDDALAFCAKLAQLEGVPKGTYRLPTEAEWEYAARAGTQGEFGPAGSPLGLAQFAWYDLNAGDRTHEVRSLKPNAFGLYDVQGNVAEWCGDWYDPGYYPTSPKEDPPGPAEPVKQDWKLARGGAWCFPDKLCRVADRYALSAKKQENFAGFRVVRTIHPLAK